MIVINDVIEGNKTKSYSEQLNDFTYKKPTPDITNILSSEDISFKLKDTVKDNTITVLPTTDLSNESLTAKWDAAFTGKTAEATTVVTNAAVTAALPSAAEIADKTTHWYGSFLGMQATKEGRALINQGITVEKVGRAKFAELLLSNNRTREETKSSATVTNTTTTPGGGISSTTVTESTSSTSNSSGIGLKKVPFSSGYSGLATPTYWCGSTESDEVVDIYKTKSNKIVNSFQTRAPEIIKGVEESNSTTKEKDLYAINNNKQIKTPNDPKVIMDRLNGTTPSMTAALNDFSASTKGTLGLNSKAINSIGGTLNGSSFNMLNGNFKELSTISKAVDSLSGGNFPRSLLDRGALAGLVSTLTNLGTANGIKGILPALMKGIKDKNVLSAALDDLVPNVLKSKSIDTLKDIANGTIRGDLLQRAPDIANEFFKDYEKKDKLFTPIRFNREAELDNVSSTMTSIDPNWDVCKRNGGDVTNVKSFLQDKPSTITYALDYTPTQGTSLSNYSKPNSYEFIPTIGVTKSTFNNGLTFSDSSAIVSSKNYFDTTGNLVGDELPVTLTRKQEIDATIDTYSTGVDTNGNVIDPGSASYSFRRKKPSAAALAEEAARVANKNMINDSWAGSTDPNWDKGNSAFKDHGVSTPGSNW